MARKSDSYKREQAELKKIEALKKKLLQYDETNANVDKERISNIKTLGKLMKDQQSQYTQIVKDSDLIKTYQESIRDNAKELLAITNQQVSLVKLEVAWSDAHLASRKSLADNEHELLMIQGQKYQSDLLEAALDSENLASKKSLLDNAREMNMLLAEGYQSGKLSSDLSDANLASLKAMVDSDIKRKMIKDKAYQTSKQASETISGIVNAEEEILNIIREKKVLENPAFKQKTKELEMLKKKVDREKEIEDFTNKWVDKWKDFKEIIQDPKIAGGMFLIAMTNEASKFGDTMSGLKDDMALSNTQAAGLADEMLGANIQGFLFGISAKKNAEAMAGLAEGAASLKDLSAGAVLEVAKMSRQLGLSAKDTGKLVGHMSVVEGMSLEASKSTLEITANLARGADVPIGKVMKDVADNMELTSKFGNISVKELGKMAVEAAKMGTSLSQMNNLAEGLLDLDNARTQAMQLSVLLGRTINIDRAQALMYEGKIEEGYKEMLRQLGGIQGFNNMDYYQKREAAKLMGVTVGELQKQLNLSAGLVESGERQATATDKALAVAKQYTDYWKENATMIAASVNMLGVLLNGNTLRFAAKVKDRALDLAHWIKERAMGAWRVISGKGGMAAAAKGPLTKLGKADMRFKVNKLSGKGGMAKAAARPLTKLGKSDMRFGANKGLIKKVSGTGGKAMDKAKGMGDKMSKIKGTGKEGNVISRFFNAFKKVDWSSIAKAIVAMAGMGLALLAFVPPFKMFAEIPVSGIIAGIGTLLAMTLAMKIMGKATSSILKGAIAMGILGLALIPAAYSFGLLGDVDPVAMITFAGAMVIMGLAAALMGMTGPMVILGAAAMLILGVALIPAAFAMSMLKGVDPIAMIAFAGAMAILGASAAGMGFLLPFIAMGSIAMLLLGVAITPAAAAFSQLSGVDPSSILGFAASLGAVGMAVAAIGIMIIPIILGSLAMSYLVESLAPAAAAFAKLGGIDSATIIGFGTGLLAVGAAVAALGFMILPIWLGTYAMEMLTEPIQLATAAFSNLSGVNIETIIGFGTGLLAIGTAIAAIGLLIIPIALGYLAMKLLIPSLEPAAEAFGKLGGLDPKVMLGFGGGILAIAGAVASMGVLIIPIMLGAFAMGILSKVLGPFGEALSKVPMDMDVMGFAMGVGALGVAGIGLAIGSVGFILMAGALSIFAMSLLLLVPLMPVLEKLSQLGILGGVELTGGGGESGEKDDKSNKIVEKLDELIAIVSKGGKVEMDGATVGRIINLASGPIGS